MVTILTDEKGGHSEERLSTEVLLDNQRRKAEWEKGILRLAMMEGCLGTQRRKVAFDFCYSNDGRLEKNGTLTFPAQRKRVRL